MIKTILSKKLVHVAMLSLMAGICVAGAKSSKPNIIYFYADDLGWGTLKANNPESVLITPALDELTRQGMNFKRGYGCMVCSPARSSQQTGFHQGHTWTDRNDPNKTKAIRAEDTALGTVLKKAGYRTAYYGKWGYGADSDKKNPAINNPQTLPINHGYDEMLAELHHVRAHTFLQETLWRTNTSDKSPTTALVPNWIKPNNPLHPNYPAYQNDKGYPKTAYADDSFALAALDFVRTQSQIEQPFFVTLAFQTPHTPLKDVATMPKWFDAYKDVAGSDQWKDANKQFAAMVTRMDAHMQNIIDVLDDPNGDGNSADSIRENTLIIFASDNGGQGGAPYKFFQANGILSGTKGSVKEGGIRVPTVMNWKGTIAPSQTTTMPTDVTDIMPTLAELAGTLAPVGTDGVSIAPTISGKGTQRQREFLIHEAGGKWTIIRGEMKLHNTGKLYNLKDDPSETNDISDKNKDLASEMKALAEGEFAGENNLMANSFRSWVGKNGSAFEAEDSWSKPAYPQGHELANDYSPNTPNARWNTVMKNATDQDSSTTLKENIKLLALEVTGNTASKNSQRLVVPAGITLTGRNEIRLGSQGVIALDGGTLDTLRWVDIRSDGSLLGGGQVTGGIYNSGKLLINGKRSLSVKKNFHQFENGALCIELASKNTGSLEVAGEAHLNGALELSIASGFKVKEGDSFTIIQAEKITGKFDQKNDLITVDGQLFQITYTTKTVTLLKL